MAETLLTCTVFWATPSAADSYDVHAALVYPAMPGCLWTLRISASAFCKVCSVVDRRKGVRFVRAAVAAARLGASLSNGWTSRRQYA